MEISNVHRRQVLLGLAALATGPLWASAAAAQSGAPDFALIYHAAQLANEAYDGSSTILGDNPGGQGYIATPGRTDVQYFLLTNDKKKVQAVAVRGSDNNVNWSLDMDTMGDDDAAAGILMHAGFRQAAEAIWQDVRPRIKKGYTVYLTGHSLGGAVAAILGIYMRKAGIKVGGIITFGQPKFTNLAGAEHYADLPLVRIIYQNDIVSLLPPEFNQTKSALRSPRHGAEHLRWPVLHADHRTAGVPVLDELIPVDDDPIERAGSSPRVVPREPRRKAERGDRRTVRPAQPVHPSAPAERRSDEWPARPGRAAELRLALPAAVVSGLRGRVGAVGALDGDLRRDVGRVVPYAPQER